MKFFFSRLASLILGLISILFLLVLISVFNAHEIKVSSVIISAIPALLNALAAIKLWKISSKYALGTKTAVSESQPKPLPVNEIKNASEDLEVCNAPAVCSKNNMNDFNIPEDVLSLLWIKGGDLSNYTSDLSNEPSLVDVGLEVSYEPDDNNIGYYPSYHKLTPSQRGKYLKWLEDITQPIDIGYVFIFYYGLERHIVYGKRNEAVSMIYRLRSVHKNNSFQSYSADAIMTASYLEKNLYFLNGLDDNGGSQHLNLFIKAMFNNGLKASELMKFCRNFGFTNTNYIKNRPEEFESALCNVLESQFGEPFFKLTQEDFLSCQQRFPVVLANYSLRYSSRISSLPDITSNKELCARIYEVLAKAHNSLKKNGKPISTVKQRQAKHADVHTELTAPKHFVPNNRLEETPINGAEIVFINQFYDKVKSDKFVSGISSDRKSDGTLNFMYKGMQIGRVRLQGKKHHMQILVSLDKVKMIDGELEDFIPYIDDWIKYIKKYLLK